MNKDFKLYVRIDLEKRENYTVRLSFKFHVCKGIEGILAKMPEVLLGQLLVRSQD